MKQDENYFPKRVRRPRPKFRAELLGRPAFYVTDEAGNETEVKLRSRQALALLAYLHVRGRSTSRDRIVDLLWHEDNAEMARASLRVLLARLKKLLPGVLNVNHQTVSLTPGSVAWDTVRFHALQERGTAPALTEAALLYSGEFMQDFDLRVAGDFERWLEEERDGWRERYNGLMRRLVDLFLAHGQGSKALFYIERWGQLEPESEAAYRQHMWLSWKEGRSNPAITKYRKLVKKLGSDLGIEPEESTRALYELILGSLNRDQEKPTLPAREEDALLALAQNASGDGSTDPHTLYQSNLELTSFIGREHELNELVRAIKQHRLVTVWGVGGVGKTRLTLEACRALRTHFDDSVFVFTCEAWTADAFTGRIDALATSLQPAGPLLFVLDSFDLVASSHLPIVKLLRAVPQAAIVVTSRAPLGVLGERPFNVLPLPCPKDDESNELVADELLALNPAVQLFWDRAFHTPITAARTDPDRLRLAGRVANALAGLPLGLEIAASGLAHTPLDDLARLAETAPHTLHAEHRTVARHVSLVSILAETWERLSVEQRKLLVKLVDLPEPFSVASDAHHLQLERQDLQFLVYEGVLYQHPDRRYAFPRPFRHFVRRFAEPHKQS